MAFTGIGSAEGEYLNVSVSSQILTVAVPDLTANSLGVVMVMLHYYATASPVSSATWAGTAMTATVNAQRGSIGSKAYIFHLFNPPDNGNKNIQVTFPDTGEKTFHIVVAWANANAGVGLDDTSTETGSVQNPDIVSTQAGANELVFSASGSGADAVDSPSTTGCTELRNYDSGENCSVTAYSIPASSGDATHQHNYIESSGYAIVSASFKEAAGGSNTPSNTVSQTPSNTVSQTVSATPSNTVSQTPSNTVSQTPSNTISQTVSATPSNTVSQTPSNTISQTPSNTVSQTPSNTVSRTVSATPSHTVSATPSNTISQTPSNTVSQTPSNTVSQTVSATPSNTVSQTVSATASHTVSATPSNTISMTPSATPSRTVSATPSHTVSRTPSMTPSATGVVAVGGFLVDTKLVNKPLLFYPVTLQ